MSILQRLQKDNVTITFFAKTRRLLCSSIRESIGGLFSLMEQPFCIRLHQPLKKVSYPI